MSTGQHEKQDKEVVMRFMEAWTEAWRRQEEPVSLPWQWPMAADTARAVRMARAWTGWTQEELARAIQMRPETVSSWEHGRSIPLQRSWEAISRETGCSIATLSRWVIGQV
jgi:ribosome-binding protein aMBF1 (putative translation factor)